jgi:hypothetical protein
MSQIESPYLAHQLKRWMRPDAHHFVRHDWRRDVRPEYQDEVPFALYERKYSPDQPRDDHGRWTSGEGQKPTPSPNPQGVTTELSAAGHHEIPHGVYGKYPLPPETRAVFDQATTGPLLDPSSNWFDKAHRAYNDAVQEEFDRFLKTNRINPEKMTPDQARAFLGEIFISEDPRIRDFNMRMRMREIRRFILRRLRGSE